jgi:hypothetical protein
MPDQARSAWYALKPMYCPNCHHIGPPNRRLNAGSKWLTGILLLLSFFIPWLLILAVPAVFLCLVEKRETSCRECGWAHLAKGPPAGAGA